MDGLEKQIAFHQKQCMHFRRQGHEKEQESFHAGAIMGFSKGQELAKGAISVERKRIIKELREFIAKETCLMKSSIKMLTVMDIERFIKDRIEKEQNG